jgi:hypothetical protein
MSRERTGAGSELDAVARLLDEVRLLIDHLRAHPGPPAEPAKACEDCGRTARELIPVQDPDGRVTGWVGPTCHRRRTEAAERGAGTQLPLAQEGAGRG